MRILVFATAIVMFGVGAFFVWFGNDNRDSTLAEEVDMEPIMLGIMVLGAVLFALAIFGIFVALCQNKCFICIYSPFMLLLALLLLIAGAGMLYARGEVDKTLDSRDDCRDYDVFEEADDELVEAAVYFCSDVCPCDLKDPSELDTLPPGGKFNGTAKKMPDCPCTDNTVFDTTVLGVTV
jgi:hypothetical protein